MSRCSLQGVLRRTRQEEVRTVCTHCRPKCEAAVESVPPGESVIVPLAPFSPQGSLHSDPATIAEGAEKPAQRKGKRVRLLLDSRIELTDEELKVRLPIASVMA